MEEVGIDAKAQIAFLNQCDLYGIQIIAGSMRTIDQVMWTFLYNTVPTIGEKVWDQIIVDKNIDKLLKLDYQQARYWGNQFSPDVTSVNRDLSIQFFEQMDLLGKPLYEEFISNVCN